MCCCFYYCYFCCWESSIISSSHHHDINWTRKTPHFDYNFIDHHYHPAISHTVASKMTYSHNRRTSFNCHYYCCNFSYCRLYCFYCCYFHLLSLCHHYQCCHHIYFNFDLSIQTTTTIICMMRSDVIMFSDEDGKWGWNYLCCFDWFCCCCW